MRCARSEACCERVRSHTSNRNRADTWDVVMVIVMVMVMVMVMVVVVVTVGSR
jgi:hypothetical protein